MALGPYPTLVPNCGTITLLIWLMYQILMNKPSDQLSIWLMKSLCLKMMFISFNWSKCITPFYVPHPCTYSLHCIYFCTQSFTSPWLMLSCLFLTTLHKAYCIVLYRISNNILALSHRYIVHGCFTDTGTIVKLWDCSCRLVKSFWRAWANWSISNHSEVQTVCRFIMIYLYTIRREALGIQVLMLSQHIICKDLENRHQHFYT